MFIFKICVWIKSGNIFLAHPVYAAIYSFLFGANLRKTIYPSDGFKQNRPK